MDNAELEKLKEALSKRDPKVESAESPAEEDTADNYTIDLNGLSAPYTSTVLGSSSSYNYGNITISNGGSSYSTSPWTSSGLSYNVGTGSTHLNNTLEVTGENADVVINGKSLAAFMDKMEQRLAILQPNPEKLEHFEALKKAYAQYKTLEALCELPKNE